MPIRKRKPRRSLPSYEKLQKRIAELEVERAALSDAVEYLMKQNDEQMSDLGRLILQRRRDEKMRRYMQTDTLLNKMNTSLCATHPLYFHVLLEGI